MRLAAPGADTGQMYLDLAKQWKELAECALAIERHRRSELVPSIFDRRRSGPVMQPASNPTSRTRMTERRHRRCCLAMLPLTPSTQCEGENLYSLTTIRPDQSADASMILTSEVVSITPSK